MRATHQMKPRHLISNNYELIKHILNLTKHTEAELSLMTTKDCIKRRYLEITIEPMSNVSTYISTQQHLYRTAHWSSLSLLLCDLV